MIEAFSNGGRGDMDSGDPTRASSLTGNYRPLVWSHFIGVETAARRLSKIAFPMTDMCHRLALRVAKGKPGFVRTSFAERHLLWEKPVMVQLQRVQNESRRAANAKKHTAASANEGRQEKMARTEGKDGKEKTCGEAVDATHPNIHDIHRWREVIVAMLKPQTDFGWHRREHIDDDAAETMRSKSSIWSSSHDDGETKVEMVCYDNPKAMEDLSDLGTDVSSGRGGSGGVGGGGGQQEGSTISSILQHVGKHLQSDPEVVLAAVRRDRGEMFHASEELRGDKAFVLSAIEVSISSGSDGGGPATYGLSVRREDTSDFEMAV